MACSPWRATSPGCRTSWPWRGSTTRWSPSTTRTPPACSAARAGGPRSTTACWARWISSRPRWARRWAAPADYLTQRSRPQLFSNALPPTVAGSALAAVRHLEHHPELVTTLHETARYFRERLLALGFRPLQGETPIVPVILGETAKAIQMSELLLDEGVFVTGFGYPVVPQGHARIRCQLSAGHTRDDLDFALGAFRRVGAKLGLI